MIPRISALPQEITLSQTRTPRQCVLARAFAQGQQEKVLNLLQRGATIDFGRQIGPRNLSPLAFAKDKQWINVEQHLLRQLIRIEAAALRSALKSASFREFQSSYGQSIFSFLLDYTEDVAVVRILLENEAFDPSPFLERVRHAAIANELLNCPRVNPNHLNDSKETPLHRAIMWKRKGVFNALLASSRVNPNLKDQWYSTPMHRVIAEGDLELFKSLYNCPRLDPYLKNTALHVAVEKGQRPIINYLLEQNADVNFQDDKGNTPLHYTTMDRAHNFRCWSDSGLEDAKFLLSKGANPNVLNKDKESPLYVPMKNHWLPYVSLLLDHGADTNIPNYNGVVVLHYALYEYEDSLALTQLLLDKGKAKIELAQALPDCWKRSLEKAHPTTRAFIEKRLSQGT